MADTPEAIVNRMAIKWASVMVTAALIFLFFQWGVTSPTASLAGNFHVPGLSVIRQSPYVQ